MKNIFYLFCLCVFQGCMFPLVDYGMYCTDRNNYAHVINQYEIVNLSDTVVNVVLDQPPNTNRDLLPCDTLRFFCQNLDDDGLDVFSPYPFGGADYAKISFGNRQYTYSVDLCEPGNPLVFNNYEIIRQNSVHYIFIFFIIPENYN